MDYPRHVIFAIHFAAPFEEGVAFGNSCEFILRATQEFVIPAPDNPIRRQVATGILLVVVAVFPLDRRSVYPEPVEGGSDEI